MDMGTVLVSHSLAKCCRLNGPIGPFIPQTMSQYEFMRSVPAFPANLQAITAATADAVTDAAIYVGLLTTNVGAYAWGLGTSVFATPQVQAWPAFAIAHPTDVPPGYM